MEANGVEPNTVDTVVFTHVYADHVGENIDGKRRITPEVSVPHHPAQAEEMGWSVSLNDDGPDAAACHSPRPGLGHIARVDGTRISRAL